MKHWRVVTSTQLSHSDSIPHQMEQGCSEYKPSRWYVSLMTPQGRLRTALKITWCTSHRKIASVSIFTKCYLKRTAALLWCLLRSLSWPITDMSPICSHWTVSVDTVAELSLMAKKKNPWPAIVVWASLSSVPGSLSEAQAILLNPVRAPWDSRWDHQEWRQDEVTERDTYLIYCMWSDCSGDLGLAGNSHLFLLFFIILQVRWIQLKPSETVQMYSCYTWKRVRNTITHLIMLTFETINWNAFITLWQEVQLAYKMVVMSNEL